MAELSTTTKGKFMKANLLWHTQRANGLYTLLNGYAYTLRIYKSTMPTASAISSGFTAANYTSDLLLSYSMATSSFGRTSDNYQRVFLAVIPAAVAASQSGTATWFSLAMNSNTGYAIVGDVSDVAGNAALKMMTTNIVSGTSYDIYSFAFQVKQ